MKIGLVTFFRNYNYGSVLQCYAIKRVLEAYGCNVVVLNQIETGLYWRIRSLIIKFNFILSCLFYPERWTKYKSFLAESSRSCESLSSNAKASFESFVKKYINPKDVSFKDLCNDRSYTMFITGSDQVWSVSAPMLNPFLFLRFAPKNKRASYAASTGSHIIPRWYKRTLRRYINDFRYISLRESLVIPSLEEIGCKNLLQHIDPTLLKSENFWIKHSSKCEYIKDDKYLLLYFLNKPSSLAIAHINEIVSKLDFPIYTFPYVFDEWSHISKGVINIDVSPEEFVQVIQNACVIFTDSFHGVAFSINLKKEFFVYEREYSSGANQGSRIESILSKYRLEKRLIKEINQITPPLPDYISELENDRNSSLEYIKTIIG